MVSGVGGEALGLIMSYVTSCVWFIFCLYCILAASAFLFTQIILNLDNFWIEINNCCI